MALVKVRRDGNSLAVTIPAEEARLAHIEEGMYVEVGADAGGSGLRVEPVSIQMRSRREVISAGRRVMERNKNLYDRLADCDKTAE